MLDNLQQIEDYCQKIIKDGYYLRCPFPNLPTIDIPHIVLALIAIIKDLKKELDEKR